ncbi:hypothetical protein SAY87_000523 [Trapa incisa]|uniref:non-specific serine/threonine protein kinase n=1 Tax=Trapa incisa TaxID=236973 RepID=A0AAN7JGP3_9MYRT|nr:hypothetical protein SAY87_000523 [Trapa incisa]
MAATLRLLFFLVSFFLAIHVACCVTDPNDASVLQSLKTIWQKTPPSWDKSNDPCGLPWEGVTCKDWRVTALGLSTMGIKGQLSGDIGSLTELTSLDLSYNKDITGSIPKGIQDLQKLSILILAGCGLSGSIPDELGNLTELSFLALNSNNFTGIIPPSLGKLSKLYWFDIAENQLSGPLPISSGNSPGLDLLLNAKHFHFNKNQLSGPIPENLFSSRMQLLHVLFDDNKLTGTIPSSIGLVQTLEALRLDRNSLSGGVPSNINNLTKLSELNLANNKLNGSVPNLASMTSLNYVDFSNNTFDASEARGWFSTLPSLTVLVAEFGSLYGPLPQELLNFPQLQQVLLRNNNLNGTLNMTQVGSPLQLVDLRNNQIQFYILGLGYANTLMLYGNPICSNNVKILGVYCQIDPNLTSYSTSLERCGTKPKVCSGFQKLSPASCDCRVPYEGRLTFRAPSFRDPTNANLFGQLEDSLSSNLSLSAHSAMLQNPFFDQNDYLQVQLSLFPASGKFFNRSDVQRLGFMLSNQTYKPPDVFGPYVFSGFAYPFPGESGVFLSNGAIAGIAAASVVLLLGLIVIAIYAIRQKKRAQRAVELSRPFASWVQNGDDAAGGAPQLRRTKFFSFDELKKCTNNFSNRNEIGSGGYGKVYRGMLPDGMVVAIKRAQQGSMQGALEFKTEIELLSRVHHKNLVGLVGFCFEQQEQMLVYEFMSNGTLRDSLSGSSGIALDWKMRLHAALGSARGIAYLHELANPPIIHRDIKTTNILLDENLVSKVADFGLSKLVSDSEKEHVTTQVKGTLGYLDPEYYMTHLLTEKSDVYSFGVVMLELITSSLPIEKGKYIVREIRSAMKNDDHEYCGLGDIMDPSIRKEGYLIGFSKFLDIALQCVEESANNRPTMNAVVKAIETILQDDGLHTNPTSASSSVTDFGASQGPRRHPYDNNISALRHVAFSDSFDYSSGYNLSAKIEPK